MEKLLISGNGKGHKTIVTWWVQSLVGGCVLAAMCYYFANDMGFSKEISYADDQKQVMGVLIPTKTRQEKIVKNEMYYAFMGFGAVSFVGTIVMGFLNQKLISKTSIDVYEDGIKGIGSPGAWLQSLFSFQMSDFHLTYDQMSSVDVVNGNVIHINVGDAKHKVYAMNAREIRDTITAQKSKIV